MAKRNACKELNDVKVMTNYCEKFQMTMVNLFQYMIGNTDWSVPNYQNIKLILPKGDSAARPYAVPYDFDYAGLVNTTYAIPAPQLGIEKVVQRVYRGFSRTMTELEDVLKVFNLRKDSIYALIRDFAALSSQSRSEMIDYLDEFYRMINDPAEVKEKFIDNARLF